MRTFCSPTIWNFLTEKQHSLLRWKRKERRNCLLQWSLMSWKKCAKSSSLNKVKPIFCIGLGKKYKAGKLTALSYCFKNWRRVFKIAASCLMKLTPPLQDWFFVDFSSCETELVWKQIFFVGTFANSKNSIVDQGKVQDNMIKITINVGFVQKKFGYFFVTCIQFAQTWNQLLYIHRLFLGR